MSKRDSPAGRARRRWRRVAWRAAAPNAPGGDDRGVTLIEVLVTVVIILLVMFPAAKLFYQTQGSSAGNSARQDAAALGTSVISGLQNTAYGSVGFTAAHTDQYNSSDPGYYTSGWNTTTYLSATSTACSSGCASYYFGGTNPDQQLVTLASAAKDASGAFNVGSNAEPFAGYLTGVQSGTWSFTVVTRLLWTTTAVQTCPDYSSASTEVTQAEKTVSVTVSWRSPTTGTVSATQTSILYPGSQNPYKGPSYSSSSVPATPVVAAPVVAKVTGQINLSWSVPTTYAGNCYSVSWVDVSQNVTTTGMLKNSASLSDAETGSGWITAPNAGTGTATYAIGNLPSDGPVTFFVVAYSPNGVESAQSLDTPSAIPLAGPIITAVSATYGPNGSQTSVTLTGSGFTSTTSFAFGTLPATIAGGSCTSLTSCTVLSPSSGTGVVNITGTDSALGVTSPMTTQNQFSYAPEVTGLSVATGTASGGTSITITGQNFVVGATTISFGLAQATAITCTSTTSCSGVTPAAVVPQGGTLPMGVDVVATTAGGSSQTSLADQFSYT